MLFCSKSFVSSHIFSDHNLKYLHSHLLSDIIAQEEKYGTWENPLYLMIQDVASLLVSQQNNQLQSSSTAAIAKKKVFRRGSFASNSLSPTKDEDEIIDDGGKAALTGAEERNRLLARCLSSNHSNYFVFFNFSSFKLGKRWNQLTDEEIDELMCLGYNEIQKPLPPLVSGTSLHEWGAASFVDDAAILKNSKYFTFVFITSLFN